MVVVNQTSFQFKYNTLDQQATQMSESKPSMTPKGEVKSSIKKRVDPALLAKPDRSKSKNKAHEPAEDAGLSEMTNVGPAEKTDQKLLSNKSSKREKLKHKAEVIFLEQMTQAERSERSAKVIGSYDKQTTIKENHNTIVESNQREFSHSRDPEEHLSVSKKKINTESKKSKTVESGTKHSKTETKNEEAVSVSAAEIKEQKTLNTVDEVTNDAGNEKVEEKPETAEEKPSEENPQPESVEPKRSTRKFSKDSKATQVKETEAGRETKMSKNLKRSEVSKSEKEVQEEKEKDLKKSKSVKHGLRSETKSKDSKLNGAKSGVKKAKPNERWH